MYIFIYSLSLVLSLSLSLALSYFRSLTRSNFLTLPFSFSQCPHRAYSQRTGRGRRASRGGDSSDRNAADGGLTPPAAKYFNVIGDCK